MPLTLVHNVENENGRPLVARISLPELSLGGRIVLGQIDLEIYQGETIALTGRSGIGKTSLLRVLAGLDSCKRAKVQIPTKLSMVFQEPTLLAWRSLRQNLTLPLRISNEAAEEALCEVGLAGRGDDFPGQLSLGQQRRLALARAFAAEPDLLLLDEPFVSLDEQLADDMMTLFENMCRGRNVATLIVTHSPREASRLCNRVLKLDGHPAKLV